MKITYSSGKQINAAVVQVWDDLHNERAGYFRAFWCDEPAATCGSPVIGYCSPGGTHRTIRAVVREVLHYYPDVEVYRNGKQIKWGEL